MASHKHDEQPTETHSVWYTTVYPNGWEYGHYEVRTVSAHPWRCARMIWARIGDPALSGIRLLAIDGQRVNLFYGADEFAVCSGGRVGEPSGSSSILGS